MDDTQLPTTTAAPRAEQGTLERWGPFEHLQRVGRGSFGEVYRAFDPTLQRHVALKLLLPSDLPGLDATAMLDEARAMARVRHPNVVPIYGVATYDGRSGFWSDFVQGKTLAELLSTHGPYGPREAAPILIDVCRAVGAVHAAGFVHRDIKSGNVMREEGGRILLMDFGLTHAQGTGGPSSGTPVYMAPELFQGQPATNLTDIYALGVLLFNLLTGTYPVEGSGTAALRRAHAAGVRRTLLDVRPDLPERLAHVVGTALAVDPAQRFATTGLMIGALSDALGMAVAPAPPAPAVVRRRSRWWLVAPAAGLLAAAMWLPRAPAVEAPAAPSVVTMRAEYERAHELVQHYYRPQALETAMPLLEQVVASDAQFAPGFTDLAWANYLQFVQLRDSRYVAPARESALRAIALDRDLASAHAVLGALYAETGQNDLASHELDEALRLDKFNAAAYGALASLYERQGRDADVEPTLRKALTLAPDDWSLLTQLGTYYLDQGKWLDAEAQYKHAIALVPDNSRAHNNLGLVYRALDQLDASAAAFRRAIELEPTALRYRNLGMVLADAGNFDAASAAVARSMEMRPDQYRTWGLRAFIQQQQGGAAADVRASYMKAIDLAKDLRRARPRDTYLLADVGSYYAAVGMETESLPLLAQAATLGADVPEVLFETAVAYEALHRRDEALDLLVKATIEGYAAGAIARHPGLVALRTDPRYRALAAGRH